MWFRGLSNLSVDAKGRVAMPKAHRDVLEESGVSELVVTASTSKCLSVYRKEAWDELEKTIMDTPNVKSKSIQTLQRVVVGYANMVSLDSAGRISLTAEQRRYAGIERKAMFVGQGTKFEIWDEANWEREFGLADGEKIDMSDVPDDLLNLSL